MAGGIKNLKQKYRSLSAPAKASILFAICNFLQKGISFFATPIYTRIMATEAYGQYSVFLSWYQIITVFTTLNMWNYLINNGMVKFCDDRKNFVSALQGLSTMLTIVWLLIYLPFSNGWESLTGLSHITMLLMFAELIFMPSFEYYCAVKRFYYEAGKVVALTITSTILTPLISIPLILISDDQGTAAIAGRVLGYTFVYATVFFHMIWGGRKFYNKEYWAFAIKFNVPLIPHFLSVMILQQSDRIMIEWMCGEADAAIYSVAYQAGAALQIANSAILSSFIPYTYQAIKGGYTDRVGKKATSLLFMIGVLNFLAILLAPEVIAILAPDNYQAAIYVIPPVAMSNLFMFLFNLFANVEYYWGKTNYVAVASTISAVVNIILNYIFIKMYGFIAAGYTTLACYVLYSLCHYFFMSRVSRRFMDGERIYNMRAIAMICGGLTAFSLAINMVYDNNPIRYAAFDMIAFIAIWKRDKLIGIVKEIKR